MTAKDFIFPNSIGKCYKFFGDYLDKYKAMKKGSYLTYENYYEFYPNVLCTTQNIVEDINGNFTIAAFPNKRFSLNNDIFFGELKDFTELNPDEREKISLIFTQRVNNLIGTKFFKLKFLNENKIRFAENVNTGAELKFLIDSFLCAENIAFIPQLFYGKTL